jgi:hypothetical protein
MKEFLVFLNISFQNEKTKQFINNHLFAINGQRQKRKDGGGEIEVKDCVHYSCKS